MVSSPARARPTVRRIASTGDRIRMSRPVVSKSPRYSLIFAMSCASCGRSSSNQNTAGEPVARARATASFTQSRTGKSFVWHMRQISPASTVWLMSVTPAPFVTRTSPADLISKVLSCDPYSSAFCAMRPTFGVVPIVAGSNAPFALQSSMTTS